MKRFFLFSFVFFLRRTAQINLLRQSTVESSVLSLKATFCVLCELNFYK